MVVVILFPVWGMGTHVVDERNVMYYVCTLLKVVI